MMIDAPSTIHDAQLKELNLNVVKSSGETAHRHLSLCRPGKACVGTVDRLRLSVCG